MKHLFYSLTLCALLTSSCADDLRADIAPDAATIDSDAPDASSEPIPEGNISHTNNGDGSTTTVVNATDHDSAIFFDLETGEEKTPNNPEDSMGWDLSFTRFAIAMNGGVSGTGGVEALLLNEKFEELSVAPIDGYETDQPDGPDENQDNDLFFDRSGTVWYDYDPQTHVLTPRDVTYIVRSVEGYFYKIEIEDYYSDAGTSGYLRFTWGPVNPSSLVILNINASANDSYVFLDLETGALVSPANPGQNMDWDLAVRRTGFRTNSGTSGPGVGGAVELVDLSFDMVINAPAEGYVLDELLLNPGPPGSGEESRNPSLDGWYNYDSTTHMVSPRETVYVVRHADGEYSKIEIENYSDGMYTVKWVYAGMGSSDF